jgi:hypothetical protein
MLWYYRAWLLLFVTLLWFGIWQLSTAAIMFGVSRARGDLPGTVQGYFWLALDLPVLALTGLGWFWSMRRIRRWYRDLDARPLAATTSHPSS